MNKNKDDVSTKIVAGMDRWQNTFEEMIHLRSSNNQVFKDNYWAQNGFEELRRYVKQGSDFSKELAAILQERIEAENYYSKCLVKFSLKLSKACKESVGSCADSWKHVAMEMEKRAEIHRNYANALTEELVKPMKNVLDTQTRLRKKIEANVEKTTRTLAGWRTVEAKSKKQSHAAARENEKLQDAAKDVTRITRSSSVGHIPQAQAILQAARAERGAGARDKDAAKLHVKKQKTEDAVKRTEVEYYNVCVQAERARLEWESSVVKGAGMLEALEEERLQQMKASADCYLRLTSALPPQLAEVTNSLINPIRNANPRLDMRMVQEVRSSPSDPSEQLLPNFYCEHTTLAMNKDRRRQALLKILQLVKKDIDQERKSKQGLEKLSLAMKQNPTFGNNDTQQNIVDKLYHTRSMLTYLEAIRCKITMSLNELDNNPQEPHPLSAHIQIVRDKQGLQQSVLKVPPWLQVDYQNEVNQNLQPNYISLTKLLKKGEEKEKREFIVSRATSKLRFDNIPFKKHAESKSVPATPTHVTPRGGTKAETPPSPPTAPLPPPSPLEWSEHDSGDEIESQQDIYDKISLQNPTDTQDLSSKPGNPPPPIQSLGRCRALYIYKSSTDTELSLSPGDIITIFDKHDDGWWTGELNGSVGMFPSSYVEEITSSV